MIVFEEEEEKVIQPRLLLLSLYSLSQKQLLFIPGLSGCNIAVRHRGSQSQHVSLVPSQPGCSGGSCAWECLSSPHSLAMNFAALFI